MTIFTSNAPPLPPLPDDQTTTQFMWDKPLPDQPQVPANIIPDEVPCLIDEITGKALYRAELVSRINSLANVLQKDYSIGNDDVVCVFSQNHLDYGTALWASHRLGAIVAPVNAGLTRDEFIFHLGLVEPTLLFVHANKLTTAEEAILNFPKLTKDRIIVFDKADESLSYPSVDLLIERGAGYPQHKEYIVKPGEGKTKTAFLCFSSGTTGAPNAVAISHYNVICNVMQIATSNGLFEAYTTWERRRFRVGDLTLGVLPLSHIYGLVVVLHFNLYARMTLVLSPKFHFSTFLDSIERYKITHLMIVPPLAVLLVKHPLTKNANLSSVRYVLSGAAPAKAGLMDQLKAIVPASAEIGQGYGLTETSSASTLFPLSQQFCTPGAAGQLVSGVEAKIVKEDGSLAGPGEPGDLHLRGGQVALGYWKNDAATKDAFLADGWLRTGDQVSIAENGDLFVVDRIKEMLKVKAFQVAPAELEQFCLDHPHVADAGVVGVADAYAGELPLAFIVLQPEMARQCKEIEGKEKEVREDIYKFIAASKMRIKWLDGGICFVDGIPKSPSGKILRKVIREQVKQMTRDDLKKIRVAGSEHAEL